MYGDTGGAMRGELAALLRQHRVQHLLGASSAERQAHGDVIRRYRQSVIHWCGQAMQAVTPMMFTNLPPRHLNPFRAEDSIGAARELCLALEFAKTNVSTRPAASELLAAASTNPVVERWRQAARATTLAEHDTHASLPRP